MRRVFSVVKSLPSPRALNQDYAVELLALRLVHRHEDAPAVVALFRHDTVRVECQTPLATASPCGTTTRKSLTKIRVQLLGALMHDLPEDLRIRAYDVTHRGPFPDYLNISVDW